MTDESEDRVWDIPEDLHAAMVSWLGMNRSDASEFRELYLGATAQTVDYVDYEARKAILFAGIYVKLLWKRTHAISHDVLAKHADAQLALLSRISELAKEADAADIRALTDAYMSLARPGEDDFSSLALPPMPPEFEDTLGARIREREAGPDDDTAQER